MSDSHYFKVKLKDQPVKVSSTATAQIPLLAQQDQQKWNCGYGIPFDGKINKSINVNAGKNYNGNLSSYLHDLVSNFDDETYNALTFDVNRFLTEELTAESIYQDQYEMNVSFDTMYKFWTPTQFSDYILENLVGKSLKQALLYNYFGYPIRNTRSLLGRDGGPQEEKGFATGINMEYNNYSDDSGYNDHSLGWMPNFGGEISELFPPSVSFSYGQHLAGPSLNDLHIDGFSSDDPEKYDYEFKIAQMLAGSAESWGQGKTQLVEIPKYMEYTFEELQFSNEIDSKVSIAAGYHYDLQMNSNRTIPPLAINSFYGKELIDKTNNDTGQIPELLYNHFYDFVSQRLTPTHAKMWMPSISTSTNSEMYRIMGGKRGKFESKWFYSYDISSTESEKSFKFSNLVSAMKLVPYDLGEKDLSFYINNPNETINKITKNVFDFVLQVVPDNIRYAGPKPATLEPDSPADKNAAKPEACEVPSNASPLQLKRILTGSFFELNSVPPIVGQSTEDKVNFLGEKYLPQDTLQGNAPLILSTADGDTINSNLSHTFVNVQKNIRNNKGISSLFIYNQFGDSTADYIYKDYYVGLKNTFDKAQSPDQMDPAKVVSSNSGGGSAGYGAEYAYKFGLPASFFVGHRNAMYPDEYADGLDYESRGNALQQFLLIPKSPSTIRTMLDSLPEQTRALMLNSNYEDNLSKKYFMQNALQSINPIEYTRFVASLWMTYHMASMPINFVKESQGLFHLEDHYLNENVLKSIGDGDKAFEFITDPNALGVFNDLQPLIFGGFSNGQAREEYFSWMPSNTIFLSNNGLTLPGLGLPNGSGTLLNNFSYLFGDHRDVGKNATGTIYSIDSLLPDTQGIQFHKLTNQIPYHVRHVSNLLFPVWDYDQNKLNNIPWPKKVFNDTSKASYGLPVNKLEEQIEGEGSFGWAKYVEENPLLLQESRKCVPDWCTKLQVYPTIPKDQIKYGLISNNLIFEGTKIFKTGDSEADPVDLISGFAGRSDYTKTYGLQYLSNDSPVLANISQNDLENILNNYKNEDMSIEAKSKPYMSLRFQYNTDSALAAKGDLYVSPPNKDHPSGIFWEDNGNVTADYASGEGSSEDYRKNFSGYVDLTYATDLEIDEKKLFLDMLRHGVFALAGTIDEYSDAGFNVDDIFAAAPSADSFKDPSLLESYETWKASQQGEIPALAFQGLPSFLTGDFFDQELVDTLQDEEWQQGIVDKYETLVEQDEESSKCAATSLVLLDRGNSLSGIKSHTALRVAPGKSADLVLETKDAGGIKNLTLIKVIKEWVNGVGPEEGDFDFVRIVDPDSEFEGLEGYIHTKDLIPFKALIKSYDFKDDLFFTGDPEYNVNFAKEENGALQLAQLKDSKSIQTLTDGQILTRPTWSDLKEPYFNSEAGEYWWAAQYQASCVLNKEDLKIKETIALREGIKQILDFYAKSYTEEQVDMLINSCAGAAKVVDYHIDLRPGENVKFYINVGAIYIDAFPDNYPSLEDLKKQSSKILSLDTRYYIGHLAQANHGLNKLYLDIVKSDFRVEGINFALEADRIDYIPFLLKKLVAINGFSITSEEANLINIGFDDSYNIVFISYNEGIKENNEVLLPIGFDYIKSQEPFDVPNTMSLLYHHRQLRNPLLKWKFAVEEFFIEPKPKIVPKEETTIPDIPGKGCTPPRFNLPSWQEFLGPLAEQLDDALQLDPRFDLGSFQFNLTDYIPPCPKPPSGRGNTYFKGEIDGLKERQFFESFESLTRMKDFREEYKEYVGDFMGSADDIRNSFSKVLTLEDAYDVFLRKTGGFPGIYNKVCRCFVDLAGLEDLKVPNLSVDLQGPEGGLNIKPLSYIPSAQPGPALQLDPTSQTSLTGKKKAGWNEGDEYEFDAGSLGSYQSFKDSVNTDPAIVDAKDLICSFCLEVPDFFLRLPTTNILDLLLDALIDLLQLILAQLLLQLLAALIDLLLQCPEITCPEGLDRVKDFGAQDISDLISSGIDETPDQLFDLCGVVVDGISVTTSDVQNFLSDVSEVLSSGEVLQLFDGSLSRETIKIVHSKLTAYPGLLGQIPNTAKMRDFFRCIGFKIEPNVLAELENDIIEKYQNPDKCNQIYEDAKEKLQEKCGILEDQEKIINDATQKEVEKYKALANLIREIPDLTKQLPSIFADDKGNKGLLSGLSNPTIDFAIDKTIENTFTLVHAQLKEESQRFFDPQGYVMVKQDLGRRDILTGAFKAQTALFAPLAGVLVSGAAAAAAAASTGVGTVAAATAGFVPLALAGIGGAAIGTQALVLDENAVGSIGSYFPMKDKLAPFQGANQSGNHHVDVSSLPEFFFSMSNYDSGIISQLNPDDKQLKIKFGDVIDPNGVLGDRTKIETTYQFVKPDEENGIPVYTKNNRIVAKLPSLTLGEEDVSLFPTSDPENPVNSEESQKQINDNLLLEELNKHPLEKNGVPPQVQYYSNMMTSKIIDASPDLKNSDTGQILYQIFNDLYYAKIGTATQGIAEVISNAELNKSYEIDVLDQLDERQNGIVTGLISIVELLGITNFKAQSREMELGRMSITPTPSNQNSNFLKGLIDTERTSKIIKDNYDFSNYSDPNSDDLGMPHYAFLSGVISSITQLICGETLARGIASFSKFPKFIYEQPEDLFTEVIYLNYLNFLNGDYNAPPPSPSGGSSGLTFGDAEPSPQQVGSANFYGIFKDVLLYTISTRSDFITDVDIGPYTKPQLGVFFTGKITDPKTSITYKINSLKDALKFYIREEIPSSVKFLDQRIQQFAKSQSSGQNFTEITETNPLEFISYNKPLFVHDKVFSEDVDALGNSAGQTVFSHQLDPYDLPSSLFDNSIYSHFINGRFFFQMYYKIEDLQEGDENYREEVANRTVKLKNILSQDNMFELISLMSGNKLGTKETDESVTEPMLSKEDVEGTLGFRDFFKSIKFGMRLCYGFIRCEKEFSASQAVDIIDANPQSPELIVLSEDETYKPYESGQLDIFKTISDAIDEQILGDPKSKGNSFSAIKDLPPEIVEYIESTKSLLILEGENKENVEYSDQFRTYIFPVLTQEIDVANNSDDEYNMSIFESNLLDVAYKPQYIREFLYKSQGKKVQFKALNQIVLSPEYLALFKYSLTIPELVNLFTVLNIAIVSADPKVTSGFSRTKNSLRQLFMNTYNMTGSEKYKKI